MGLLIVVIKNNFSKNQADKTRPCLPVAVDVANLQHSGLALSALSLVAFLRCRFGMNRFDSQPEGSFLFQNPFF
jgi:hypothetical protein